MGEHSEEIELELVYRVYKQAKRRERGKERLPASF